ncbi:glycosyltransferase family 9 [Candidatus Moduliflexus flocculans]|uniref:Glycosyltransferase family 9 n=1 Tax=Candidatus Moduliflexus flocculans TaxID=1499966 RepID=A0A0S6VPG1_9BACT|nr:glycosyltransferase family 9 [Candidatus Moduliflexus flocculans]
MTTYPVSAKKILIIQFRQIGDVLLTTPAVKALRDFYPDSEIWFFTEAGPAKILQGNPHIDRIVIRQRKARFRDNVALIRELRKERFDLVIDFFCNGRSAWMSFLIGAAHRVAAAHRGRSFWYTDTPAIQTGIGYAAEDKLALLRAIGIPGTLIPPVLHIPDESNAYIDTFFTQQKLDKTDAAGHAPIVTIDPTSRRQSRQWIRERYVQLADELFERHQARSIFIWGPGEREMVDALIKQARYPHLLACQTDLMQLAALIAKSDLHIGNCSAPRHLAVAVRTPSLIVMGPTSAANWTYPSPQHRAMCGNVECLECQKTECATHECMTALTVEMMADAAEELLEQKITGEHNAATEKTIIS